MIGSLGCLATGTSLVRVQVEDFRRNVVIFMIEVGSLDDKLSHTSPVAEQK